MRKTIITILGVLTLSLVAFLWLGNENGPIDRSDIWEIKFF